MRALVKFAPGPGNVAVREVPAPELTAGKVLIDVGAVAICGTDRSAIAKGQGMTDDPGDRSRRRDHAGGR